MNMLAGKIIWAVFIRHVNKASGGQHKNKNCSEPEPALCLEYNIYF